MNIRYLGPPAEAPVLGLRLEAEKVYQVPDEVAALWVEAGVAECVPAAAGEVAGPSPAEEE